MEKSKGASKSSLRGWQADLTEGQVFTITDGTRDVLAFSASPTTSLCCARKSVSRRLARVVAGTPALTLGGTRAFLVPRPAGRLSA